MDGNQRLKNPRMSTEPRLMIDERDFLMANMANGENDALATKKMRAIPGFSLTLGNGKKVPGSYAPPDMSRMPPDTEYLFATNNGILVIANDPETLSKNVEEALLKNEEEKKQRKRENEAARAAARKAPSA